MVVVGCGSRFDLWVTWVELRRCRGGEKELWVVEREEEKYNYEGKVDGCVYFTVVVMLMLMFGFIPTFVASDQR